jgi:ABC-type thiamin/hydroxymethylpyrimidine transport system permease subunit
MITVTDKSETLLAGIGKMIDAMVADYGKFGYHTKMMKLEIICLTNTKMVLKLSLVKSLLK